VSAQNVEVLMEIQKVVRLLKGLVGAFERLAEAIEQKESVTK
jgi:hypothetical protein